MKDFDLEALLKLASQPSVPGEDTELNEAERFVLAVGVKEGNSRVTNFVLYHAYRQWARTPLDRRRFFIQFSKLFKQQRWGDMRFYLLDPAVFDLSKDTYFRLRREWRDLKDKRRREREEKQKKSD